MGAVTGNNLTIFAGDDMNVIGCEASCTITVTAREIITTTKGSGRGTNREYGAYDAVLQSSGVIFVYADEAAAAAANQQDPTFFHSYIVQGKKVCAKYQFTDGTITKYVIANWIVRSAAYTGQSGEYATFDIELALDGQLFESAAMQSGAAYDGPSVFVYRATGTVASFSDASLENASRIYFVIKKTAATGLNTILTGVTLFGPDPNEYIYTAGTGDFQFDVNLVVGDIVLISYDPED